MAKELDAPDSLTRRLVTAVVISVIGLAASAYTSGCAEGEQAKLYFPAGKCPNLGNVLQGQAEVSREIGPSGEGGYIGLPIIMGQR